jgi:hypothetical protein
VTWTSLAGWAAEHKIGKPHRISNSPVTTYAIGSNNGVMVLAIGSRERDMERRRNQSRLRAGVH